MWHEYFLENAALLHCKKFKIMRSVNFVIYLEKETIVFCFMFLFLERLKEKQKNN